MDLVGEPVVGDGFLLVAAGFFGTGSDAPASFLLLLLLLLLLACSCRAAAAATATAAAAVTAAAAAAAGPPALLPSPPTGGFRFRARGVDKRSIVDVAGCRLPLSMKISSYLPLDSSGRMGCFFLTWSKTSVERLSASCTIFGMSSCMWLVLVERDGLSLISMSHTFILSSMKKSNPSRSKKPGLRSSFGRAAM